MDDLISRQAAIKDAESWVGMNWYEQHLIRNVIEWLKEFPPAALGTDLAEVSTDLISRAQAIDDIWTVSPLARLDRKWVDRWLRQLPSAQPDIIRCKDCKHWNTTWQNDYAPNYHYCPMIDSTRRNDFYCADAERRTDG